jgi:hypothetical protein
MSADGFYKNLAAILGENKKKRFRLPYMKSLTNSEKPSSNPLQEACFDF